MISVCLRNPFQDLCLSAQSIVHLTPQIQNMDTRVANFFWGCTGLYFGPLLVQKIIKKTLAGPFLGKPLKMHCNAPQCTAM